MDGDSKRKTEAERGRVRGCEEYVRPVGANGASKRSLLPPGPGASVNDSGNRTSLWEVELERPRRIQNELPGLCVRPCDPSPEELAKVSSHARHLAEELARVDANSQGRRHFDALRRRWAVR